MTRSMNKKKQSITNTLKKGKEKKQRNKPKGEHGCARLKATHTSDTTSQFKADTEILNNKRSQSMIGKIKFKLFGK